MHTGKSRRVAARLPRRPLALVLASALVTAVALTGCTAAPPAPAPTSPPRPAPPESIAADLLGTWTITDVETAKVGTITFSPASFAAVLPCGEFTGLWVTAGEAWIGEGSLLAPGCSRIPWLTESVGIVRVGETWTLVGLDGAATATLTDGVSGPAPENVSDVEYSPVPLDPALTVGPLEGRWRVGQTYVVFHDASWSTPCSGGRYVELGDGYVLAIAPGISGSIGCPDGDPGPLGNTRTAGFDGEELVLFDAEGEEIVRLISAMEGWTPCEHEKRNGGPQWRDGCDDR